MPTKRQWFFQIHNQNQCVCIEKISWAFQEPVMINSPAGRTARNFPLILKF